MSLPDGDLTLDCFFAQDEHPRKLFIVHYLQVLTPGATCNHGLKQEVPASGLPLAFPLCWFKTDFYTSVASYFLR